MLFSPTRPVTPESSWVPARLPRPTRHLISFFFPSLYTQVLLYGNRFFFLRRTHKYCSMVISFFFLRRTQKYCSTVVGFFPSPYTQIQLVPSLFFSISPTAHLKSSPSDDESELETFIFRCFRGRVHDNSTFLRCPTLSKGRVRSAT